MERTNAVIFDKYYPDKDGSLLDCLREAGVYGPSFRCVVHAKFEASRACGCGVFVGSCGNSCLMATAGGEHGSWAFVRHSWPNFGRFMVDEYSDALSRNRTAWKWWIFLLEPTIPLSKRFVICYRWIGRLRFDMFDVS
ncbi:hypothetical protein V6N11_033266 [Hibiscus sabdariffa]|uniref:Uncharacterized protein n=1 Tax=Hibiscus sabdariffa TaxID=183260 RepID=A0ABR2PXM4_9ROSI